MPTTGFQNYLHISLADRECHYLYWRVCIFIYKIHMPDSGVRIDWSTFSTMQQLCCNCLRIYNTYMYCISKGDSNNFYQMTKVNNRVMWNHHRHISWWFFHSVRVGPCGRALPAPPCSKSWASARNSNRPFWSCRHARIVNVGQFPLTIHSRLLHT